MPTPRTRIVEMVEAEMARNGQPGSSQITPDSPKFVKAAILGVLLADFTIERLNMHPETYKRLRTDIGFVLAAFVGQEFMNSPELRRALDAYCADTRDTLLGQLGLSDD